MALVDTTWYVNFGNGTSTGYYAVTVRPQNTAVAAGVLRRQFTAPAVGSERVFVCIVAGTTANTTDATWILTRGAKVTDGTATWQECTGQAGLNGDLTNTATWAQVKAATPAVLGQVIKRSSGASYQICTTAGAMSASEPAFSDTAGVTTTDTTAVWTSLGPVSNFTGGQAPFARLLNACAATWFASGNTVYVASIHAELLAAGSLTINPTSPLMAKFICHDSGSYPPTSANMTTGATITVSTSGGGCTFGGIGSFYVYGITFVQSANWYVTLGSGTIGQNWYYFDNCSFQPGNNSTAAITLDGPISGSIHKTIIWNNCTVKFAHVGNRIEPYFCNFTWQNTGSILAAGSVVPTTLIVPTTVGRLSDIVLRCLDLSQLTGGLFTNSNFSIGTLLVQDCKLNASMTIATPSSTDMTLQLVRSSS